MRQLPCLFQETLEKQAEVRVSIVGNRLFAVRAEPKQKDPGGIDWRHPEILCRLSHKSIKLPGEIEDRCFALVRMLNLEFGAIDLVVLPDGKFVFLEINSNGQWYWLEYLAGISISDAIADVLSTAESSEGRG